MLFKTSKYLYKNKLEKQKKMNSKATVAIFTTLLGCGLNNVLLEYIIKRDPGAGNLITFVQFAFIALHGFIFTSKFGTVEAQLPMKAYFVLVTLFFITSVVNNWAFEFHIPIPLHMIFRAGSLIANMIMGILILKRRYKWDKYLSVIVITLGIIICTLSSARKPIKSCNTCDIPLEDVKASQDEHYFFWWTIGILLLISALLLSARMGIYQEHIAQTYGKHPEEVMYYTHLYSMPGFIINYSNIMDHMNTATNSELVEIPIIQMAIPVLWALLILNVITQYLCISSVYVLTTECASLTVTLVVTLRKFLSLLFSIIYFQNPFTIAHWVGTALVFIGTLLFAEVPQRLFTFKSSSQVSSVKVDDKKKN